MCHFLFLLMGPVTLAATFGTDEASFRLLQLLEPLPSGVSECVAKCAMNLLAAGRAPSPAASVHGCEVVGDEKPKVWLLKIILC